MGLLATCFSLLISAYPIVSVVDPRAYAAKVLGATLASNLLAIVLYKLRSSRRPEPLEVVAPLPTHPPVSS